MSLHVMVHHIDRDGSLCTIWQRPPVETLAAAEPLARSAVAAARRLGGTQLKIDIYDDLACASVWRGRPKPASQR
jgi:hypothetical protein